jgi:hypothetical protein
VERDARTTWPWLAGVLIHQVERDWLGRCLLLGVLVVLVVVAVADLGLGPTQAT